MELSRRNLLIGSAASGGLLLAWALLPRDHAPPLEPGPGETPFGAWLRIGRDGMVTVAVPQLEMGQGVTTLLPQVVAMELGADWRKVAVEPAPASPAYANVPLAARWASLWMPVGAGLADAPDSALARRFAEGTRFTATAEGLSLAAYEGPLRAAAASARAMLAMAAADRWDVDWEDCEARDGFIVHGERRLPFGKLAQDAAAFDPPADPPLRKVAPAERAVPGPLRFPRLDLPAKASGATVFAADVRVPDMLFAAIRHGPLGDSRLGDFDETPAGDVPGFVRLVRHERWLAALATNWWAAEQALSAIAPRFAVRDPADSLAIEQALEEALTFGDAETLAEAGDPDRWLRADFDLAVRYQAAPALHATLETASATARLSGGRLELWAGVQAPEAARRAAAEAVGLSASDVVLYPVPAGGSFDRRLEHDHVVEAAILAQAAGRPVQLAWSRWQEHVAGLPRPPMSATLAARTAPGGEVVAWKTRIAAPSAFREFGHRLFDGEPHWQARQSAAGSADPVAVDGAVPPYAVPHMIVQHVPAAIPLPAGRMRGQAHAVTAFFTESFVDELAARAGREPLSYRMAMLSGQPRLARCLQRVSALANWDGGKDGSGQGVACHRIGAEDNGGCIAVIATARRDETGVRVDRISAVADIGRIVNADIARQQIEGGLVFGIGLALGSSTGYARGLPVNGRLGALDLPLLADCPEIAVEFIGSGADPFDPGELGVAVAAPAIANALFSATGLRFRKLPLLSEEV